MEENPATDVNEYVQIYSNVQKDMSYNKVNIYEIISVQEKDIVTQMGDLNFASPLKLKF